jgi:hypothetical protein
MQNQMKMLGVDSASNDSTVLVSKVLVFDVVVKSAGRRLGDYGRWY